MIPDGNTDVYKEMERIKNGKYVGKHKRLFSYFKKYFQKIIELVKEKVMTTYCGVHNTDKHNI